MNIAIFSMFKPFPPMHGAANRTWYFARALARLGHGVTIIRAANPQEKDFNVKFIDKVKLIEVPFAYKNSFFSFSHWDSELLLFKIFLEEDLLSDFDIVQCEFPYLFPVAHLTKLVHKPLVVVSYGVEYDFQVEVLKAGKNQAEEVDYLRQGERFCLANCDRVFVCSEVDLKRYKELYGLDEGKAAIIPNGADADCYEGVAPHVFGRPAVLFLGSPLHPPNKQAIDQLKGAIIPQVSRRAGDVLFVFVGKPESVEPRSSEQVLELGEVDDIRPYLLGSTLCVAPISSGSGTRVKIMEYLAAGRAVVSTSKGAEGIEVAHGKNIVIADGVEEFSTAIIDLLGDEARRRYLGDNGRRLVREKYDWKLLCQKALGVYEQLAQGRRSNKENVRFLLSMFNDDYIAPIKKHCLELEAQFRALEGHYKALEDYCRSLQSNYHLLEEHCKNMERKLDLIKKIPLAKMGWVALKRARSNLNALAGKVARRWAKSY